MKIRHWIDFFDRIEEQFYDWSLYESEFFAFPITKLVYKGVTEDKVYKVPRRTCHLAMSFPGFESVNLKLDIVSEDMCRWTFPARNSGQDLILFLFWETDLDCGPYPNYGDLETWIEAQKMIRSISAQFLIIPTRNEIIECYRAGNQLPISEEGLHARKKWVEKMGG